MSIFRTIALFIYLFGYMIVHYGALRRGERRESGTVRGGCIGGFGQEDGDVLLLPLPAGLPEKVDVALRCKVAAGERLGIAQSTVENHIYLALKALRSKLSKSELLMLLFFIFLCNNSQSFG